MSGTCDLAALERELHVLSRRLVKPVQLRDGESLDRADYLALGRIVDDGPLRLTALAAALELDLSVVSRQVRSLETAGLATRETDPADARAALVRPTTMGERTLRESRDRRRALLSAALAGWEDRQRCDLVTLLARFNVDLEVAVSTWVQRHPAPAETSSR